MFNDQIECYQAIANDLVNSINEPWEKITVEVERTSESSMHSVVTYLLTDGRETSSADAEMLPFYFDALATLVSKKEKGVYKKCIFILQNDGQYNSDFIY